MPGTYKKANAVQIVDFGPFINESSPIEQKQKVAKEVLQSFQEIGFVYLINHGLDAERISGMFEWASENTYREVLSH